MTVMRAAKSSTMFAVATLMRGSWSAMGAYSCPAVLVCCDGQKLCPHCRCGVVVVADTTL